MRELFRRIVNGLKREGSNRSEAISVLQPSSFVLIQDGKEIRLNVGEEIPLDPGSCGKEGEKVESFVVSPESTYLSLKVVRACHYQESHWRRGL